MKTTALTLAVALAAGTGMILIAGCEKEQAARPAAPSGEMRAATACVNTHCPIMGSPIDPGSVPAGLTREFRGKKVGFCCGGCPAAWDKLTDEQKQAKLDKPGP